MTLRHLKIFIAVVDAGSMTLASKELHISQPSVSQAISEMEQNYGVMLFDRLSKRLYLTDIGMQLLSYARHITNLFNQMELTAKDPSASGIIKVGASMTIGTCLLPRIISAFTKIYPELQTQAVIKNTTDIEQLLVKNSLDFAVVEGSLHKNELVAIPFMDDELVLVCGKKHALYDADPLSLNDLNQIGFLVREQGSGTRELFDHIMASNDINWRVLWECDGSDGLKGAAIMGIGVAVISKKLVQEAIETGELFALQVEGLNLKRKFSIVYHKDKYHTPAMKAYFDVITQLR